MRKLLLLGTLGTFILAGISVGCGDDDDNTNGSGGSKPGDVKCGSDEVRMLGECFHKCHALPDETCVPCAPWEERAPDGRCVPQGEACPKADEELVRGKCRPKCEPGVNRGSNGECGSPDECASDEDLWNGQCKKKCASNETRNPDGTCTKKIINENTPEEQVKLCKAVGTMAIRSMACMNPMMPKDFETQNQEIARLAADCEDPKYAKAAADDFSQPDKDGFKEGCLVFSVVSVESCASTMNTAASNNNCQGVLFPMCNVLCVKYP